MWQGKNYLSSFTSTSSETIPSSASNRIPPQQRKHQIYTHFDSSPVMTDRAAQKDLDLIELALRRLLRDDNSRDPRGEDAQSKLIRNENDTELLSRLLDQLNLLKAERGQKDCENSLPTDDRNSDTEPLGSDKIGGQVRNEEVMEEIRKVKKQNKFTHVILGIILVSNVIWSFSELSVVLLIIKRIRNPFSLIGRFISGNFRGPMTENHSIRNHIAPLLPRADAYAIPHFEVPQLPYIEVPSIFQTEDKTLNFSNRKLANGGQAQENISLLDLLLQSPSGDNSE